MPKMKNKKAAGKRFKLTASGKIKFKKAGLIHKLSRKSRKGKRHKRLDGIVTNADHKLVLNTLPYRAYR